MPAFTASSTVQILAPPELVWDLLRDPRTWPDWNAFTPKATLTSRSAAQQGDGEDDPFLHIGDVYKFVVRERPADGAELRDLRGGGVEEITEVTAPEGGELKDEQQGEQPGEQQAEKTWRAVWDQRLLPVLLLRTKRVSEIKGTGGGCQFTTSFEAEGPLAWTVKMVKYRLVTEGLQMMADGLKGEAEKRATAA